jgi:hypothetical protein
MPSPTTSVAPPRIKNGILHASSAAKTLAPRSIMFGANTVAIVMPIARPVMTTPIPRLRFSTGVLSAIKLRSLE